MSDARSVEIRPLAESDRESWTTLWRGYLDYYETTLPDGVYATSFARMLEGNAGAPNEFRGLLALVDGAPSRSTLRSCTAPGSSCRRGSASGRTTGATRTPSPASPRTSPPGRGPALPRHRAPPP